MATLKSPAAKFRRSRFYFAVCGRKMIWAVTMAFFTKLSLIFEQMQKEKENYKANGSLNRANLFEVNSVYVWDYLFACD